MNRDDDNRMNCQYAATAAVTNVTPAPPGWRVLFACIPFLTSAGEPEEGSERDGDWDRWWTKAVAAWGRLEDPTDGTVYYTPLILEEDGFRGLEAVPPNDRNFVRILEPGQKPEDFEKQVDAVRETWLADHRAVPRAS